jgi:catechol 2,3-dioxygenase-like lactoylglutathione lyase family enzyme
MKRLHVHVAVDDLAQSIRFYSTLFAAEPTVVKEDYAKWMLEDPRVLSRSANWVTAPRTRSYGSARGGIPEKRTRAEARPADLLKVSNFRTWMVVISKVSIFRTWMG